MGAIATPQRRLTRRLLPSKILYHIRRVKALALGKNRKTTGYSASSASAIFLSRSR